MGKFSSFSKCLAVAGLLCLGSVQASKADTIGPYSTLITFTGNTITNPVYAPSATELVTITNVGVAGGVGIQIGPLTTPNAGNGDDCYGGSSCSTLLPTSAPFYVNLLPLTGGLVIGGTAASPTISTQTNTQYNAMFDQICALAAGDTGQYCNTNNTVTTTTTLVSYNSGTGLINLSNASLGVNFSFSVPTVSTPEPSSLLTLGSGLLGLLGFGLRRKGIV